MLVWVLLWLLNGLEFDILGIDLYLSILGIKIYRIIIIRIFKILR